MRMEFGGVKDGGEGDGIFWVDGWMLEMGMGGDRGEGAVGGMLCLSHLCDFWGREWVGSS